MGVNEELSHVLVQFGQTGRLQQEGIFSAQLTERLEDLLHLIGIRWIGVDIQDIQEEPRILAQLLQDLYIGEYRRLRGCRKDRLSTPLTIPSTFIRGTVVDRVLMRMARMM